MQNIKFLTIEEIKKLHKALIEKFGGLYGIRDEKLLDSAINMPKATFSDVYLHEDIYLMAAAYVYHIVKNHPFIDGNKRTGITTAITFLFMNDMGLNISNTELYELTIKIATSKTTKEEVAQVFREKTFHN